MIEKQRGESTEIHDHQQTADAMSRTVLATRTVDLMMEQLEVRHFTLVTLDYHSLL